MMSTSQGALLRPRHQHLAALLAVLLLAAFLHFYRLNQLGYANLYYAAAVRSMLTSWHNFFFVSFDPAGFVAVDKPPLGLWVQALSAALFGFNGISLLLPQALAGVLSVALLYFLVSRIFGQVAGLVAALVLALTPISVAANRNNTMDSVLVFTLLLAAWAVSLAVERGRLRWLLLCTTLVGIGFNIKMLQAFMVLPAFYLVYLLTAPLSLWKRLLHLALATLVLVVISLSWAVAVDATSPAQRPFVGSSSDNSVLELALGHNGIERLGILAQWLGLRGGPPPGPLPNQPQPSSPGGQPLPQNTPPQAPVQAQPSLPGSQATSGSPSVSKSETGSPGLLRLFNRQLGGQISWFLPLSLVCLCVAAWERKLSWPVHPQHQALLLWGVWLLPQAVFFSYAGLFHRYYLEMLAPAIAALAGAGLAALWQWYWKPGILRGWLLALTLMIAAVVEILILAPFPGWARWLAPLTMGLTLVADAGMILLHWARENTSQPTSWSGIFAALGLLGLLLAPAAWVIITIGQVGDVWLPYAGPELLEGPRINQPEDVHPLVDYLLANHSRENYLLATLNARSAAPLILATGEPVIALGGFSGGDQILSLQKLQELVQAGEIRFFLLPDTSPDSQPAAPTPGASPPGGSGPQPPLPVNPSSPVNPGGAGVPPLSPGQPLPGGLPPGGSSPPGPQGELLLWIRGRCQVVPPFLWNPGASPPGTPPPPGSGEPMLLWDCRLP